MKELESCFLEQVSSLCQKVSYPVGIFPVSEAVTTVNQEAFVTGVRVVGALEPRTFMTKHKPNTSWCRIMTVNKALCCGELSRAAITTPGIIQQQLAPNKNIQGVNGI